LSGQFAEPDPKLSRATESPLKIAYLTAGAAGMICGSCLHDNTLARALIALGHDVQLIPLYTPIRTDEEDVSSQRIFYGGINMYLQQKSLLFRWLPRWVDRWLDWPWLINWASGRSVKIDPHEVADLAISILRGTEGYQKKEVQRLTEWLTLSLRPDIIVFSNMLTAGCVPEIKRRMNVPVVVTLQGDDVFLRGLPKTHQPLALAEIARLSHSIDGFIAHSRFYADAMAEYMQIERGRIAVVPLGIDVTDFAREVTTERQSKEKTAGENDSNTFSHSLPSSVPPSCPARPPTVGYLARLAPEKGLHLLAEAFIRLRAMPGMERARLRIAGWLGETNRAYVEEIFGRLRSAGFGDAFEFLGEIDRHAKIEFLSSIDVLSVPTTYREPKGLFVLEAMAAGVPVVQPEHGAFPEVLAAMEGGLLHRPEDPQHLAERLYELLIDAEKRQRLGTAGRDNVRTGRNSREMAIQTVQVLTAVIGRSRAEPR
jgi:glycosyltransferase involved in cell wall biosynthesis